MYGGVVVERRKDGGGGGGGGDDDAEIKRLEKDTRRGVVSLRRRFLAIFWLLRMADWLQVREKREREREMNIVACDMCQDAGMEGVES